MREESFQFLRELLESHSPSGYEQPAAAIWRKEAEKYADSVHGDVLGNSIAALNPNGFPRIMLAAHVDEIGFIVRYISDDGFIYFGEIGGHDPMVVVGQRVIVNSESGPVIGVIGRKPWHLMSGDDTSKKPEISQMWIDIGAESKEEALKRVSIGDSISFAVQVDVLTEKLITSRAVDDKGGAFVLVETLRLLKGKKIAPAVFAVATTQEEVGWRGAHVSSYGLDAQVGIAIDVGHTADCPDMDKKRVGDLKLGGGAVVSHGANMNPKVTELILKAGEDQKIPFQTEGCPGCSYTDAWTMQMARDGMATGLLSIPLRYMHTPNEVVALSDLEDTARLLAAFIEAVQPDTNWIP